MELEELYDRVYRYCYMKVRHREMAEDITQEAFLRFFEGRGYRERGKKLAYLYTIARNLCMDQFRRKGTVALNEEIAGAGIEEAVVRSVVLRQAVEKLDADERELIFLRFVNEVPVGQIGEILGISRFAVYRKMKECVKKLECEIGKEDVF